MDGRDLLSSVLLSPLCLAIPATELSPEPGQNNFADS